ncbi:hypothetical protein ACM66B_005996 [Microbotryomycetes sp. NB124-2]
MAPIATALRFFHQTGDVSHVTRSLHSSVPPTRVEGENNGLVLQSRFSADTMTTMRSPPFKQALRQLKREHEQVPMPQSPLRSARRGHSQSASQGSMQFAETIKHVKNFIRGRQLSENGTRLATDTSVQPTLKSSASSPRKDSLRSPSSYPAPTCPLPPTPRATAPLKLSQLPPRSDSRNATTNITYTSKESTVPTLLANKQSTDGGKVAARQAATKRARPRPKPLSLRIDSGFKPLLVHAPSSLDVLNRSGASHIVKLDVGGTVFATTVATLTRNGSDRAGKLGRFVEDVVKEAKQKAKAQQDLESVYKAFSRHTLLLSDEDDSALLHSPAIENCMSPIRAANLTFTPTWLASNSVRREGEHDRDGIVSIESFSPGMTRLFHFPKPPLLVPSSHSDIRIRSIVPSLVSPRHPFEQTLTKPQFVKTTGPAKTTSPTDMLSPALLHRLAQTPTAEPFDRALGPFFQALKLKQQREQPRVHRRGKNIDNNRNTRKSPTTPKTVTRKSSVSSTQTALLQRKHSSSKRFKLATPPTGAQRRTQRRQARFRKMQVHLQQQHEREQAKLHESVAASAAAGSSDYVPSLTSGSTSSSTPSKLVDFDGAVASVEDDSDKPFTIFLDRDPTPYPAILSFLRDGSLPLSLSLFSGMKHDASQDVSVLLRLNPGVGFEVVANLRKVADEALWLDMPALVQVCVDEQKHVLGLLSRIEAGQSPATSGVKDEAAQRRVVMQKRAQAGWI